MPAERPPLEGAALDAAREAIIERIAGGDYDAIGELVTLRGGTFRWLGEWTRTSPPEVPA